MRPQLQVKRSNPQQQKNRLIDTLQKYLPGAWIDPRRAELIALYRLRYKMAMEEGKYDTALIFLNKIIELDPANAEAKLCKADVYHRCLKDYAQAIKQYNTVLRVADEPTREKAQAAMSEILEMLS